MKEWLRPIAGVVGIGALWAAAWAAAGALVGTLDPGGALDGLWVGPAIGPYPGFVGGVVFSAVLAVAARPPGFHEPSVSTVVAWGGLVGLLLGMLPLAINEPPEAPLWAVAAVVIGSMTLLGVVSAAGSVGVARRVPRRP